MGAVRNKMKYLRNKSGKVLLLLIPAILLSVQHIAADSLSDAGLDADQKTDLDTGAIEPADSVRSNPDLLYVLELLLRAPVTQLKDGEPPYDQEPPRAQDDFRTRTAPPIPSQPPTAPPPPTGPPVMPTAPPTVPTEPPAPPTLPPTDPRPTRFPVFPGRPPVNPTQPPNFPDTID